MTGEAFRLIATIGLCRSLSCSVLLCCAAVSSCADAKGGRATNTTTAEPRLSRYATRCVSCWHSVCMGLPDFLERRSEARHMRRIWGYSRADAKAKARRQWEQDRADTEAFIAEAKRRVEATGRSDGAAQ